MLMQGTRTQPTQTAPDNTSAGTKPYRYGFNGKESDFEVKGAGNQQDYGARQYDSRLGRFMSVDPLTAKYPHYSPYHFAGNTPIVAVDLDGKEDLWIHFSENDDGSFTQVISQYEVTALQRDAISSSMNGATIPNTGVVYTFDHLDGTKEVRKVGETVTVSEYKDNIFVRGAKASERFMTSMMGSSYGEGEDWIRSASFGGKASLSFNKYSIGVEGGVYSTSENNAGLYLNLNFDVSVSNGTEGLNLTNFSLPDASASLFIKANTGNEFNKNTVTNSTSLSGEGNIQRGPIGLGGNADKPLNGGKASGGFEIDFGKGKTGASGKIKNSTTIQLKTGTTDLSGH